MLAPRRRSWQWPIILVAASLLLGTSLTAFATHRFSDVPSSAIYHDAVEWMVNRGITLGCAVGLYCPDAFATRAQLALVMQRLGNALTPIPLDVTDGRGTIDLDVSPVVCQTTSDFTPSFPQRAFVSVRIDGLGTATGDYFARGVYSTNGAVSWSSMVPIAANLSRIGLSTRGGNVYEGHVDLTPGVGYRFGLQVGRASGTGDLIDWGCGLHVQIVNRNSAVTPLVIDFVPDNSPRRR